MEFLNQNASYEQQSALIRELLADAEARKTQEQQDKLWEQKAAELVDLQNTIKEYQEQTDQLKRELIELSGNKSKAYGEYMLVGSERAGNVNYKLIPELKGLNLDQYRGENVRVWKVAKITE